MDSDSDVPLPQSSRVPPSIHVSSDTDHSLADPNEPSTSHGPRSRRRPQELLQPIFFEVHNESRSELQNSARGFLGHSVVSDVELTPDAHLLHKHPGTADYVLSNIDSLNSGVLTRRESARLKGLKFIDDTPRGIPDTARSSVIPPHLLNLGKPIVVNNLHVGANDAVRDPFRRGSSSYNSDASSARSSMERSHHIQDQLHKLVSAFHERARQVKEQVVVQPPSPTMSAAEEVKPAPKLSIPLHQMPIRPPSPGHNVQSRNRDSRSNSCFSRIRDWCAKHPLLHSIEPQSRTYISWLFIVSMAFMYNAYAIPLRAAFKHYQTPYIKWWFLADYTCDALYLMDIVFFKTSVRFAANGVWVENRKDIVRRYLKSWRFKLDVAASFPFDVLYAVPQVDMNPLLRLTKLLKLPSYWESHSRLDQVARSPHLLRVLNSLAYMMWMIHANACLFYYISWLEGFNTNKWVYNTHNADKMPIPDYLHCFWRSFIVATAVGNAPEPENIYENAYMIFSWLVGVFVFALLIGQIRDIFTQMTYQEDHYQSTVDTAIRYLQNLRIPKELQAKVRIWFTYNWDQHKTLDENSLLDGLPKKLKTDLVLCVHYNTLCKVQLFQGTDQSLLRDLVLKLKPVVFLPNDYICKRGEVGKEMYIVRSGYLDVVTADGKIVAILSEGSVFGEISLLALAGGNRRTADVRSKGFSNLYVLSKADLHEVLRDYPETQEILKKKAQRLYQQITPTDQKKIAPPVEVIKTRTPTPEFVRTVIHVMDPRSSLRKRLSGKFQHAQQQSCPSPLPGQSSEEEIHLPESNDDEKMERLPTPNPTPDIPLLPVEKPADPGKSEKRVTSGELVRRRREMQIQKQRSSEEHMESPKTKRTRRSIVKSPNREKSPAPLADAESIGSGHMTAMSFLPAFLTIPLRRIFKRPKIGPVVSQDDQSVSESQELFEMTPPKDKTPRRPVHVHEQIFRLPSINGADTVGSRPPSVRSTEESTYDNLQLEPPDLEHSSSPDYSYPPPDIDSRK